MPESLDLSEFTEPFIGKRDRCTVAVGLEQLDEGDRDAFLEALARPDISATSIERVFKKRGITVKAEPIRRHRRRDCACPA